jgi:hypothetical protein
MDVGPNYVFNIRIQDGKELLLIASVGCHC